MPTDMSRRKFLGAAMAPAVFQIVPRHVVGRGYVAPNDKITLGYIGLGTQGLRELGPLLASPTIQIVAVCDPNRESNDYVDWSRNGLRNTIRHVIGNPNWGAGISGIPGGREVGREVVETYYANERSHEKFAGVSSYADFREMLEKERGLDAVKIMTPDHLHAAIAIAAMKKGKHVLMHKPLANRVSESRLVIASARESKVATYLLPWDTRGSMDQIMGWIEDGAIGTLREIHNWSNRPIWPQYPTVPTDTPPVPEGFDWDLWLGPATYRPYHPHYTHAVFRGWYDFGGGAIADMGYYSLWAVFKALDLGVPTSVEATPSVAAEIKEQVSGLIRNDYSFPIACTIRFKFAPTSKAAALDLFWYDGGMRPPTPDELVEDNREMPAEGMMFVGDRGKILSGFLLDDPRIIPDVAEWIEACKDGHPIPGNFAEAGAISETFNLGAVALRVGRRIEYDAATMEITNIPEANRYLTREYRPGWEL